MKDSYPFPSKITLRTWVFQWQAEKEYTEYNCGIKNYDGLTIRGKLLPSAYVSWCQAFSDQGGSKEAQNLAFWLFRHIRVQRAKVEMKRKRAGSPAKIIIPEQTFSNYLTKAPFLENKVQCIFFTITNSFIQQMFIKHSLFSRHSYRSLGYISEENKDP